MQAVPQFWRFKVRPFKWDDLYALQALLNIIAKDEQDPYVYSLEWLYFVLDQPEVNAERNCFVATLETDRIIGYSRLESSEDSGKRQILAGVHPDFEGIGVGQALIRLCDFNLLSVQQPLQALGVMRKSFSHNSNAAKLLKRMGYSQLSVSEDNLILWEKQLR